MVNKYVETLKALLAARYAAGGTLPDAEESEYVETLNDIWYAMTEEQQKLASQQVDAMNV